MDPKKRIAKPYPWLLIVFLALSIATVNVAIEKLLPLLGANAGVTEVARLLLGLTMFTLAILYVIKKFGPRQ